MLYIVCGQDDYTVSEKLKQFKKGLGDESLIDANTTVLRSEGLTPERLRAECAAVPFMTEKRLVIVNGLLERFNPRERAASSGDRPAAKRTPAKAREEEYVNFAEVLKNTPPSTLCVLVDTGVTDKGKDIRDQKRLHDINPLFAQIETAAKSVELMAPLSGAQLNMWVSVKVKDIGGSITPQAVSALARLIGGNLWIMSNEIAKLALYAKDRRIEEKDVYDLVANARETTIFALIDAIFDGRFEAAQGTMRQLFQAGEAPAQVLFMIVRQMGLIVRLKDMKAQGKPKNEMQSRLGLMQEFVWTKTQGQADRFSMARVKEIYRKLLETDLAIKTGKYDGETALYILVAELAAAPAR